MSTEERDLGFIMLKPLGMLPEVHDEIIRRIEAVSEIQTSRRCRITMDQALALYGDSGRNADNTPRAHLYAIASYLAEKEVEVMIVSGIRREQRVVDAVNDAVGNWQPENTHEGEIRHLAVEHNLPYIQSVDTTGLPVRTNTYCYDNLVHSSDSPLSADREMAIFFSSEEIETARRS